MTLSLRMKHRPLSSVLLQPHFLDHHELSCQSNEGGGRGAVDPGEHGEAGVRVWEGHGH